MSPVQMLGSPARAAWARLAALRFGSLRVRIALLYAGLFAAVLGLVVSLAAGGLARFAEAGAARDLGANARVFDEILASRSRQMGDQADLLAHDFGFREAVATNDAPTIASALQSLESRTRSDMAFMLTLEGEGWPPMPAGCLRPKPCGPGSTRVAPAGSSPRVRASRWPRPRRSRRPI